MTINYELIDFIGCTGILITACFLMANYLRFEFGRIRYITINIPARNYYNIRDEKGRFTKKI